MNKKELAEFSTKNSFKAKRNSETEIFAEHQRIVDQYPEVKTRFYSYLVLIENYCVREEETARHFFAFLMAYLVERFDEKYRFNSKDINWLMALSYQMECDFDYTLELIEKHITRIKKVRYPIGYIRKVLNPSFKN